MQRKYDDGVYDISNEQYHAASGISRSKLMLLDKSPYHFWHEVYSGKSVYREATPAMNIGSAFHTLLLEPEKFNDEFIISPKIDRRTTQGKLDYEAFLKDSQGKIVLTDDQLEKVRTMVSQVNSHDIVATLLDQSVFEQSIFWTDIETGIQFKARPDIWSSKMIVDLKTIQDAALFKLQRSALEYGYYLQAGMIFEACKAIGKPVEMFIILAVEKEAPHVPAVYMMDDYALQFGIDQFRKYKLQLAECLSKNKWPGYSVQELEVPNYAVKQLEDA
jgi:hypothetical protein